MRRGLLFSGGANFSDILRAVVPMSASMELAFSTLVSRLSAILDAMPFFSAVEALVASWRHVLAFALLLLIIPGESADFFLSAEAWA